MGHDALAQLLPVSIPAFATIAVAWISVRGGHRVAKQDTPFEAQEHGEHAHTRDVIRLEIQRVLDRIDLSDTARGLARQSDQRGLSAERVEQSKRGDQ